MTHSTTSPAIPKSDWYTFLRSAFINGLKAYGAALMVHTPEPTLTSPTAPSQPARLKTSVGAPEPSLSFQKDESDLGTQETNSSNPKLRIRAFPQTPAWRQA